MAQVTITLNGRTYRLQCGTGEEPRLIELADVVRSKLQALISEFGQAGDDRLLLMSALMIADELLDARARLAAAATQQHLEPRPMSPASQPAQSQMIEDRSLGLPAGAGTAPPALRTPRAGRTAG